MSVKQEYLKKITNKRVNIYLINGIRIDGTIKQADEDALVLEYQSETQLIMLHAVSTISPAVTRTPGVRLNRQSRLN